MPQPARPDFDLGTHVNDDRAPIAPDVLAPGAGVHLGAWTTITVERQLGSGSAG